MAAKLRLALTQNSSPTPLANRRRVAQIAVSKGSAFGRPPQRAKYPIVPKRHPQMAQSPAKGHGPRRRPHGVDGGDHQPTACRVSPTGGGGKPPPYGVEPIGPRKMERACQRRDT